MKRAMAEQAEAERSPAQGIRAKRRTSSGVRLTTPDRYLRKNQPPVKGSSMDTEPVYVSRYEQRIKLMQDVIADNSPLSAEEARALAILLLRTLEEIPEKVR